MDGMTLRANQRYVNHMVNGYIQTFRVYGYDGSVQSINQYYNQLIEEVAIIYNFGFITQHAFDSIKENIRNQFYEYYKVVL